MEYETIIGLEVHVQLLTNSKMFCACSSKYADDAPNTHVCPVCLGMPGVLPTINRRAVEYSIMTALALNCRISEHSHFDRKNYSYPDLMKGYQISQYDFPLGLGGWLDVAAEGHSRRIGITRVHLEEDVAKLTHVNDPSGERYSLVDVNRSGVPLMEIVSEPDMRSPEEARQYAMKLRSILCCLEVSTGNMEEGSLRCDANISIRPVGSKEFMPKVEVKNMNSFKALYLALNYEAERQRELVRNGGRTSQETRGWSDEQGITVLQRSKEYAHDYRYFPEPDLPPMSVSKEWVEEIRVAIPELPDAKKTRFMTQYGLSAYDAGILVSSTEMAQYFETVLALFGQKGTDPVKQAKSVSNWMLGELSRLMNAGTTNVLDSKIRPPHLVAFIELLDKNVVSGPAAKTVFQEMFETGKEAADIVREKGLNQISDTGVIDDVVRKVLADNPSAVAEYRAGKEQVLKFLLGQVMKLTRGRANPQVVGSALIDALGRLP